MAQLSSDCFAFGGELLSIDAALRRIAEDIPCIVGSEHVPLQSGDGRILAEDVIAPVDLPPFDNSAVDGYAVRFDDLNDRTQMQVVGRTAAGMPASDPLPPGSARRVFTGAALPPGADTVFMQEDVSRDAEGCAHFPSGLRRGANTRSQGEDIARGACALPRGRRLRPQDLALAAALGLQKLPVRLPIRVALFSTGDELVESGRPLAAAQRYDSNRVLLAALLKRAGAQVHDLGILADRQDVIAEALAGAAQNNDLVLTSGGISTGEEDHVKAAVESVGQLTFWRLAIKPGRPVAMGTIRGIPFVGLPGNPVAAFVTFTHIARPLIDALSGAGVAVPATTRVTAEFNYRKKAGRREYVRVRLSPGPNGEPRAHKHPVDGAGVLTSLTESSGIVELTESVTAVAPGDSVGYLPFEGIL